MEIVPDASVAAKWFRREIYTDNALALLNPSVSVHVPDFFYLEMDSLVSKWIRRGFIRPNTGDEFRQTLRLYKIKPHSFHLVREHGYQISVATRTSPYDCLYLALAIQLGCKLVTADSRYYENIMATELEQHLLWIEDVPP